MGRKKFIESFKPLHSKGVDTPLEERKFPVGVACAVIAKYSIEDLPLHGEETEIDRHQDVFDFLEFEEDSPWYNFNPMQLMVIEPTIKCDYKTLLFLMSTYIQNIRLQ